MEKEVHNKKDLSTAPFGRLLSLRQSQSKSTAIIALLPTIMKSDDTFADRAEMRWLNRKCTENCVCVCMRMMDTRECWHELKWWKLCVRAIRLLLRCCFDVGRKGRKGVRYTDLSLPLH